MLLPRLGASASRSEFATLPSVDGRARSGLVYRIGAERTRRDHGGRAIFVSPLEAPLLDALLRLARLLDAPQDLPVLGPLLRRELRYRLLQGERLAEMALGDGRLRRAAGAIAWIKEHFTEALQVEALAGRVAMSASTCHSDIQAVTAMSPIQDQKHLRLQEARRLLLTDAANAGVVAYHVGYASPGQFSRDYARHFGEPPGGTPSGCESQVLYWRRFRRPVSSSTIKRLYRHIAQSVCPWNVKFSQELAADSPFRVRPFLDGKDAVTLATDILTLEQKQFSAVFRKSPMKRAKLAGLRRNARVVLNNVEDR